MKLINFIIKSMCGFFILISFASCDDFLDRDLWGTERNVY